MEVPVGASLEDVALSCSYVAASAEEVLVQVSPALVVKSCRIEEMESSGGRLTGSGAAGSVIDSVMRRIDLQKDPEDAEK